MRNKREFTQNNVIDLVEKHQARVADNLYNSVLSIFDNTVISGLKEIINNVNENNNIKSKMISSYFVKEKGFELLGTGTNRVALYKDGYVYKIPLDYYGIIDNRVEMLVSNYERIREENGEKNINDYIANTYMIIEDGMVIMSEYINVLSDVYEFENYKSDIVKMCKRINKRYVFDDIGFKSNNYKNFGLDATGDIKILDYGYLKPNANIDFTCPICKIGQLEYNKKYTVLKCNNPNCEEKIRPFKVFKQEMSSRNDESRFYIEDDIIEEVDNDMETLLNSDMDFEDIYRIFVTGFKI